MPFAPELRIVSGPADLFASAAQEIERIAQQATRERGRFSVALSGGSTPKGLFSLLAGSASTLLPWSKTYFFWSDERHVPPDDPESNYRMANEAMLSKAPVPAANIYRIRAEERDASVAAAAYEQTVRAFFGTPETIPSFDLILLGLGPEGHVASLFPGSPAMEEKSRLVVSNWVEKFATNRITFTFPLLNHAACVMFLVSGEGKAEIVRTIFEDPAQGLPAQRVQPENGRLVWLMDQAAAAALKKKSA